MKELEKLIAMQKNEILTNKRIGEEPPIIAQRKKNFIFIQTLANEYFSKKKMEKVKG